MIYIQKYNENGKMGNEEAAILRHAIMERLDYKFITEHEILTSKLTKDDLFVGSIEAFKIVLRNMNTELPVPDYYPPALTKYRKRKIRAGTKADVLRVINNCHNHKVFIKPEKEWKTFTGTIVSLKDNNTILENLTDTFPLWISEIIELRSEFRVYVQNHKIKAVCQYHGEEDEELPIQNVLHATEILKLTKHRGTYAFDWGITQNDDILLIEKNDAFSIGKYKGISDKDYYNFLKSGWVEILKTKHFR